MTSKLGLYVFLLATYLPLQSQALRTLAKFEPVDGKCLVFIGQDLEAVGGLDDYTQGYTNFFRTPSGVTTYTNLSPTNESYGFYNKGLDGLLFTANWGAGDVHAQRYLEDRTFKNSAMAIGLSMVSHEKRVARGKHDDLIVALGTWIKNADRPIFLRIGYEFDGWDWNHYKKKHYLKAWRRIHTIFGEIGVTNVAYVWQSKGNGSSQDILEDWYPGDDIVDWCAYSYFGNPDTEMITFARSHGKPVFIAEATPIIELEGLVFTSDLKNEKTAITTWEKWFIPFFNTLNDHQDVIKAFSYINSNWTNQPMWLRNSTFQKVDARLQISTYITQKWNEELSKPRYLDASTVLWK